MPMAGCRKAPVPHASRWHEICDIHVRIVAVVLYYTRIIHDNAHRELVAICSVYAANWSMTNQPDGEEPGRVP